MIFTKKPRIGNLKKKIDFNCLPEHIAFILDGNGRWAKKRMLSRSLGHREGAATLKRITKFLGNLGINYMTAYVFSTENWSRSKEEVGALMALLLDFLRNAEEELKDDDVRIKVIGEEDGLSDEIRSEIARVEKLTEKRKTVTLCLALNYGSRREIVHAVKEISQKVYEGRLAVDDINEITVSKHLYTGGIPDPDLLIRTSGEYRISNFLLWQMGYSEFIFSDKLWPDYTEADVLKDIIEYQNRDRRFGGRK